MLRVISTFNEEELPIPEPELNFLAVQRLAITLLSGTNKEAKIFSSSYSPEPQPETHSLKYWRANPIFNVSSASGAPGYGFHFSNGGSVSFDHGDTNVLEDQLFVHEIFEVGKGVNLDSKNVADGRAEDLRTKVLWRGLVSPDQNECLNAYYFFQAFQPGAWEFWRDWYQGFLDGKPLDWELQRRVALIPDADWEKGPEHIARLIEEIREPFILKERIAELEAILPERGTSRLGIGGNNPPEGIDAVETPQQAITIIWTALDDLKEEADEEEPDPGKIKAAIAWLKAVLASCAKWTGGHLDAGIREAAKTGGKAAGAAGVAYVTLIQPEVQTAITKVLESASKWLGY